MRDAFGSALLDLGRQDLNLFVVDADNAPATRVSLFAHEFPERYINVGCAEQNMIGVAAGLAATGATVVASTFSIFILGRAYEQLRNTVSGSSLSIVAVGTHSGISVGADGPSHSCPEDIGLARSIPGFSVAEASCSQQMGDALKWAIAVPEPVYLRVPRASLVPSFEGKPWSADGVSHREGRDLTLVTYGQLTPLACAVGEELSQVWGIETDVIETARIWPVPTDVIEKSARTTGRVVVAEEHRSAGGIGEAIALLSASWGLSAFGHLSVPDGFVTTGTMQQVFDGCGLTHDTLMSRCLAAVRS